MKFEARVNAISEKFYNKLSINYLLMSYLLIKYSLKQIFINLLITKKVVWKRFRKTENIYANNKVQEKRKTAAFITRKIENNRLPNAIVLKKVKKNRVGLELRTQIFKDTKE